MTKLPVSAAAEVLGISKEAIYNRIRRNTLSSVVEDGIKYVVLSQEDEKEANKKPQQKSTKRQKIMSDERYIEFLLEHIGELKEKISSLENDKDRLIKEKEELLVKSRDEVEKIYKDRDKQLRNILTLVTRPLLTYMKKQEAIDAEFEDLTPYERGLVLKPQSSKWQNLEEYMQQKRYSEKKRKSISTAIASEVGFNKYVKEENGVLFIRRGKKIKELLRKKSWN